MGDQATVKESCGWHRAAHNSSYTATSADYQFRGCGCRIGCSWGSLTLGCSPVAITATWEPLAANVNSSRLQAAQIYARDQMGALMALGLGWGAGNGGLKASFQALFRFALRGPWMYWKIMTTIFESFMYFNLFAFNICKQTCIGYFVRQELLISQH